MLEINNLSGTPIDNSFQDFLVPNDLIPDNRVVMDFAMPQNPFLGAIELFLGIAGTALGFVIQKSTVHVREQIESAVTNSTKNTFVSPEGFTIHYKPDTRQFTISSPDNIQIATIHLDAQNKPGRIDLQYGNKLFGNIAATTENIALIAKMIGFTPKLHSENTAKSDAAQDNDKQNETVKQGKTVDLSDREKIEPWIKTLEGEEVYESLPNFEKDGTATAEQVTEGKKVNLSDREKIEPWIKELEGENNGDSNSGSLPNYP